MRPIYLDYNATTPVDPKVARAMQPFWSETFGNPSSGHAYGVAAREAVEAARQQVAGLLGCRADEIVFTSGGTESNNHALRGAALARRDRGNHLVTSAVEHPAVTAVCGALAGSRFEVTVVPVDSYGRVDPDVVERALGPATILVSIMHANNEVGTLEPVADIARMAHARGVLVHSDCAQSVGKVPVLVNDLGVDLLSLAGHKIYAPKGVGALFVRRGVELEKLLHGARQESGRRAGTENVPGVVGLGEACDLISRHLPEYADHMRAMRDRLEAGLGARFPDAVVHGHPVMRLPNTCSIGFPDRQAALILARLQAVAASAGAACHAGRTEISSVLGAMGVAPEVAVGTLRLSVGRFTTADEVDRALEDLATAIP